MSLTVVTDKNTLDNFAIRRDKVIEYLWLLPKIQGVHAHVCKGVDRLVWSVAGVELHLDMRHGEVEGVISLVEFKARVENGINLNRGFDSLVIQGLDETHRVANN